MRRGWRAVVCMTAWALGLMAPAAAQQAASAGPPPGERPRIGLVLSGGGARGGAHLGVLKVLERLQVPLDVIVGTSAGSIIGAAYASGMSTTELERELRPLGTATLFRDVSRDDLPLRRKADDAQNHIGPELGLRADGLALPKGAVAGVAMEAVLRRLTAGQRDASFDRLPIPFRAVATDVTTAEMVVIGEGSLATAVRASMALPAIVNPVEINGRLLVDGGVSRNLPVDVARALGAEVVIAVDAGTPLHKREDLVSLLRVSDQMVRVLIANNVAQSRRELGPRDVLITPELGELSTADFDRMLDAAQAGEKAAEAAAGALAPHRLDDARYAALRERRRQGGASLTRVDEVRIEGTRRVNPEAVRVALATRVGQPFDPAVADHDMRRLYGWGDFEHVDYRLDRTPEGRHVFTARVNEKAWGPHYLRFGLTLSNDFSGNAFYNLLLTHRRPWLNALGAEWRNDLQIGQVDRVRTEWHQPLDTGQRLFAAAHAESRLEPFDLFAGGERIGRYRRRSTGVGADLGLTLGNSGELRAGLAHHRVSLSNNTGLIPGSLLIPSATVAGLSTSLRVDTQDSLRFPRAGYALDLQHFLSEPALGASQRYGKLDLALRGAWSRGAHTLRAAGSLMQPTGDDPLPDHELVSLGGFLRLSGYRQGEFLGRGARLGRLVYTYRVARPGLLDGVYAGVSAEAGRIDDALGGLSRQDTLHSHALLLAADTPLGPLYLAWGRASSSQRAVYLYLGMP